jgi:phosphoserine phosphatase RsbU/P
MATVLYAVLDRSQTNLTVSNAGHLPPALVTPDQPATLLRIKPDLPIGAYRNAPRHNTHASLPSGACLFLYTDGLVERRRRLLRTGINTLLRALRCAPADTMCTIAMDAVLNNHAPTDDIAILAVRRD